MCADTEKHVLPRLDTRGKKANSNRCEAKRLKSPALSCQDARVLLPISEQASVLQESLYRSCTFAGGNISFNSTAIIIKLFFGGFRRLYSYGALADHFVVHFVYHYPHVLLLKIYSFALFWKATERECDKAAKSGDFVGIEVGVGARPEILYLFLPITRIGSP